VRLATASGQVELPAALDESVPEGSVFVPYAYAGVELNRLGAPANGGMKVRASRVMVSETVTA